MNLYNQIVDLLRIKSINSSFSLLTNLMFSFGQITSLILTRDSSSVKWGLGSGTLLDPFSAWRTMSSCLTSYVSRLLHFQYSIVHIVRSLWDSMFYIMRFSFQCKHSTFYFLKSFLIMTFYWCSDPLSFNILHPVSKCSLIFYIPTFGNFIEFSYLL